MSLPKAVVFDLGKVLLDFDYRRAAHAVEPLCRVTVDEIMKHFGAFTILLRYESGLLTTQQFYEEMCKTLGFSGDADLFTACFADIFTPIEPMIELQAKLRASGVPTYIFSNTNEIAITHVRKSYPFFHHFNGYVLSFEHRGLKPEPEIYEVVERVTGQKGEDLLYIDDRPENIETARQRGWRGVVHETAERSIATVRSTGILG